MNREIILTRLPVGQQMVLAYVRMEDGRAVQIELEPPRAAERTGNIYVGRIEKLVPQMNAAFVRISGEQNGFLPLAKARRCICRIPRPNGELKEQDELLVQIEREAIRGKLPSLKTALEFPGRFLVLLTDSEGIFWSPRLKDEQKERTEKDLRQWMKNREFSFGVLVRTNAGSVPSQELKKEFERLYSEASSVCRYGVTRSAGSCLRRPPAFWQELLEGIPLGEEVTVRIVTDEQEIYRMLKESRDLQFSDMVNFQIQWYEEKIQPLYKKYGLEEILRQALVPRVELKSGGFLMVEQTEAFVAVDVNSGRQKSRELPEKFYFQVNREAAAEIARQLRLRNLSGTILIDFINMKDAGQLEKLFLILQQMFLKDPVRTRAVDITALKIMEVTRQKMRQPLWEQVSFWEQEYQRTPKNGKGGTNEIG